MLRGQSDAFSQAGLGKRNQANDTDFERMPVKPQKSHSASTGFTSECAGLATDGVMEQAMTDAIEMKLKLQYEKVAGTGGYGQEEIEAEKKELTDTQIDEMEDRKKD